VHHILAPLLPFLPAAPSSATPTHEHVKDVCHAPGTSSAAHAFLDRLLAVLRRDAVGGWEGKTGLVDQLVSSGWFWRVPRAQRRGRAFHATQISSPVNVNTQTHTNLVVNLSLLRVLQHIVGLVNLLELLGVTTLCCCNCVCLCLCICVYGHKCCGRREERRIAQTQGQPAPKTSCNSSRSS